MYVAFLTLPDLASPFASTRSSWCQRMAENIGDLPMPRQFLIPFATSSCRSMPCFGLFREALSRIPIRGLRNRRLLVRIQWGVLQLTKVVGAHSGGLFLFQFCRPKCNEIKGLAKFGHQFAVSPRRVRKYEIEQSAFCTG